MLKLISKIYKKDKVTLDLINALMIKFESVENKIEDFYKQIFLDSADWYLELKETEMAISKGLMILTKDEPMSEQGCSAREQQQKNFLKTPLIL